MITKNQQGNNNYNKLHSDSDSSEVEESNNNNVELPSYKHKLKNLKNQNLSTKLKNENLSTKLILENVSSIEETNKSISDDKSDLSVLNQEPELISVVQVLTSANNSFQKDAGSSCKVKRFDGSEEFVNSPVSSLQFKEEPKITQSMIEEEEKCKSECAKETQEQNISVS